MGENDLQQLDKELITYIGEGKTWSDLCSHFNQHPINVITTRLKMLEDSKQLRASVVWSVLEVQS